MPRAAASRRWRSGPRASPAGRPGNDGRRDCREWAHATARSAKAAHLMRDTLRPCTRPTPPARCARRRRGGSSAPAGGLGELGAARVRGELPYHLSVRVEVQVEQAAAGELAHPGRGLVTREPAGLRHLLQLHLAAVLL